MIQETNFRKRLEVVRKAVFDTQKEMAKWLHEKGALRRPAQTTIQNWENDAKSKRFSQAVLKKLEILREVGVNPRYFDQAHVTEWRMAKKIEMDEGQVMQLREQLAELANEILRLKTVNEYLVGALAKEGKGEDPLLRLENQELKNKTLVLMEENRALKAQIDELQKKIDEGSDPVVRLFHETK